MWEIFYLFNPTFLILYSLCLILEMCHWLYVMFLPVNIISFSMEDNGNFSPSPLVPDRVHCDFDDIIINKSEVVLLVSLQHVL